MNVTTKTPDFLLPVRLGELFGLMLSPKHTNAVGKEAIATKPNGTGPFKLVTWTKNERLVLEANESYWRGAPKVKTIVVRPILEDAARIAALQTGEVDLIAPVPHVRIAELKRNDKLVIKTIAAPRIFHVTIDVRKPPFDNVKVRQALNYAVDVNAIVKTPLLRLRHPAGDGRGQGRARIRPERASPTRTIRARRRRCWPRPASRTASRPSSTASPAASPITASRPRRSSAILQKVGMKAKQNVFEFSAFGPRRVQNRTAPLFIYSIGNAYLEPSWVIRWMTQGGLGMHYKNAKLDEMLTQDRGDRRSEEAGAAVRRRPEAHQGRGAVHLPLPGRRGVRDEHPDRLHAAPGRDPVAVPARDERERLLTCAPTSRARLATAVLVILGVSVVSFFLTFLTGDPAEIMLPPGATADADREVPGRVGLRRSAARSVLAVPDARASTETSASRCGTASRRCR